MYIGMETEAVFAGKYQCPYSIVIFVCFCLFIPTWYYLFARYVDDWVVELFKSIVDMGFTES